MAAWEAALGELVRARGAALVGYAYLLCGDRAEAEDLVQDALVRTFAHGRRSWPAAGGADNLEGYVRRAVATTYLDGFRRRRRWAALRHLAVTPETVGAAQDGVLEREAVAVALRTLPPRERACVVLRFYEDWTVAQVADGLGVSLGTAKRYLSDGVHALEDALGPMPATRRDAAGDEVVEELEIDLRRTR